jgi:glycosyltransferase involved in cell wall biosynthesis
VFALPSLEEGGGSLAVAEAMQYGLPVVASNCDGIGEDVTNGVDGLLVPPGDPWALATALERLTADLALCREMGAKAHETYNRRFSARAMCDGLARVYAGLGFEP